jgi:hypothetical protein
MIIALVLIAIWTSIIIVTWALHPKPNAPAMLMTLLGTGGLSFMTFLWTVMKENGDKLKAGKEIKDDPKDN